MNRLKGLDGVRGFAALGVVAFHVAVLGGYTGYSSFFDRTIGRGDCFVRMFFMLSSFSLMCAYFEKYLNGQFDVEYFLFKRINKIFPIFFIIMIAHSIINASSANPNNFFELIGTASMLFAIMPSNQDSIVWAGWSMGIQMIFYLIFPVFLVITKNKKRAWITFFTSALLLFAYINYYGIGVSSPHINIVRQFIFFAAGAVIYHYKNFLENLTHTKKIILSIICIFSEIVSFSLFNKINEDVVILLAFSSLIVLQIVGLDYLMKNTLFCFLGKISFEIYLVHAFIYRLHSLISTEQLAQHSPMVGFIYHFVQIVVPTVIVSYLLNQLMRLISKTIAKFKTSNKPAK